MAAPLMLGGGMVLATGIAVGVAVGAGVLGTAVIGKRLWEERRGWRDSAAEAPEPTDPMMDAPPL
ncbi:hypothetical protein [Roseomonas sp. AR75]|uniref:hypothetical protein n=1 Tax=Roseomonas sp. AR75 TaxID=2562311 RepID=UPI0010C05572|nr:hypothetical protein [Roseomonas sp. AR75]